MTEADAWLGFLSDEQRAGYHGPAALRRVAGLVHRRGGDPQDLFVAANLLALELLRRGSPADARLLCREEIAYALRRRGTPAWPQFAMFALQPQINLLRLQGHTGETEQALGGLRLLERISAGRGAELPDLSLDDGTVRRMREADLPVCSLARNVLISDSCKILWRCRDGERLLEHCERLRARWPPATTPDVPRHAAEAPWLVDALGRCRPPASRLDDPEPAARRTAYINLLHYAAQARTAGRTAEAAAAAVALLDRRHRAGGPFASPLTPLRWSAHLAATLLGLDLGELARPVLKELAGNPYTAGDPSLERGVRDLLGLDPPPPPEDPGPDIRDMFAALLDRLGG